MHDLGDSRLDADIGIGDPELDAAQTPKGKLSQEAGPEWLGLRTADDHRQWPARFGAMGSALRGRLATVLLHHVRGHDLDAIHLRRDDKTADS